MNQLKSDLSKVVGQSLNSINEIVNLRTNGIIGSMKVEKVALYLRGVITDLEYDLQDGDLIGFCEQGIDSLKRVYDGLYHVDEKVRLLGPCYDL